MGTNTAVGITAVISANNTKFKSGIKGAKTSLSGFKKSINTIGPAILAAFSVGAIKNFGKAALRVYDQQLKAEASLLTALDGRVVAQQKLIRQAQELQRVTLFGDEETIAAQSMIAAFVSEEKQIRKLIPLIQDFATAKQMSLVTAADLVTKTFASSTNALSRYGITVEGTALSAGRLDDITNALSKSFLGQAEAAAQADKVFTQLSNAYGDFQENLAAFFSQKGGFNIFHIIQEDLQNISKWLDKNTSPALKAAMKDAESFMDSISDKSKIDQFGELNKKIEEQEFIVERLREVHKIGSKDLENIRGRQKKGLQEVLDSEEERIRIALKYIEILESEKNGLLEIDKVIEMTADSTDDLADALADFDKMFSEGDAFTGLSTLTDDMDFSTLFDEDAKETLKLQEEFTDRFISMLGRKEQAEIDAANTSMQLNKMVASSLVNLGNTFAQSLGQVAAGTQTLAEALSDISAQIVGALGDILIMTGLSTSPVGVPLVLAGLALKGFSSFMSTSAGMEPSYNSGISRRNAGVDAQGNNFTIRGNDLTTAYDDNTTLNQRLY